ncbi:MAG: KH domain-containing protein [Spirochaetia bacterium]|nr:KH domain-containing protein [Spirochaetia bacterium]
MQILEINSANDKDALKMASEALHIAIDDITVQLHKKGSGGFLGMGSKNPSTYRVFAIKDKTPVDAVMKGAIISVTEKMGYGVEVHGIEKNDEGKTYIQMSSEHAGYVIGKKGKTLEAIQFIVNLIVQQFLGEPPKILLDIENYRDRRAKYLTDIAIKIASAVKKTRRSKLLEPLNPYERRIIHMALQEDEDIVTESEGMGVYKRVRIKLKQGDPKEMTDDAVIPEDNFNQFPDDLPDNEFDEKQPDHNDSFFSHDKSGEEQPMR